MSETTSDQRAQELFENMEEATEMTPGEIIKAVRPLLHLLMEGAPVRLDRLAARANVPREKLGLMLERLGAERDEEGHIVGLILSLNATPHRYEAEGQLLYGWCALDTFVAPVLGHTARVTSPDPISGETVHLTISPEGVEHVEPPAARVALVREGDTSNVRETFCRPGRFFTGQDTAEQWASTREGVDVATPEQAYDLIRHITRQIRS